MGDKSTKTLTRDKRESVPGGLPVIAKQTFKLETVTSVAAQQQRPGAHPRDCPKSSAFGERNTPTRPTSETHLAAIIAVSCTASPSESRRPPSFLVATSLTILFAGKLSHLFHITLMMTDHVRLCKALRNIS